MIRPFPRRFRLLGFAAVLGACAQVQESPFAEPPPPVTLTLDVANHHRMDATLEALGDGRRVPLGTVRGGSTAGFTFDWPAGHRPRFEIRLFGERCTTRPIEPTAGGLVRIEIEPVLEDTAACIGQPPGRG